MGKSADEGFEVSLEGILELLLVLVPQLVGEHVGDALFWTIRGAGAGGGSVSDVVSEERGFFLFLLGAEGARVWRRWRVGKK